MVLTVREALVITAVMMVVQARMALAGDTSEDGCVVFLAVVLVSL